MLETSSIDARGITTTLSGPQSFIFRTAPHQEVLPDHITAAGLALAQIPSRLHKQVLIRTDSGGGTHAFLNWVTSRRLKYSIGFNLSDDICAAIGKVPEHAW